MGQAKLRMYEKPCVNPVLNKFQNKTLKLRGFEQTMPLVEENADPRGYRLIREKSQLKACDPSFAVIGQGGHKDPQILNFKCVFCW